MPALPDNAASVSAHQPSLPANSGPIPGIPSNPATDDTTGIAPADAAPHRPWPAWQRIVAYAILAAIAVAAVWLIDLQVQHTAP